MQPESIAVTGASGFIGGALVAECRRQGCTRLRAILDDVENLSLDLNLKQNCDRGAASAGQIDKLAATINQSVDLVEDTAAIKLMHTYDLAAPKRVAGPTYIWIYNP